MGIQSMDQAHGEMFQSLMQRVALRSAEELKVASASNGILEIKLVKHSQELVNTSLAILIQIQLMNAMLLNQLSKLK